MSVRHPGRRSPRVAFALFALLAPLALLGACRDEPPQPAPPADADSVAAAPPDVAALSGVLLAHLALEPGERVLVVGVPGRWDTLDARVREGVRAAGAADLGAWSVEGGAPAAWDTEFTRSLAGLGAEGLPARLRGVDAAIMMPGAAPEHPVYAALQEVLRAGQGRTVHFHWSGAYALDGRELDIGPAVDRLYERVLVETDYQALDEVQRRFEDAARGGIVRVTTPAGTDLSFRIGDRPVNRQDGDASAARAARARILIDREIELPAGAIRVAPLEESVEGTVVFPPSLWSGEPVEGLTLRFERGVAVEVRAGTGLDAALAEMDAAGPGGRAFRELAVGFNPLLAVPEAEPWIPYYGYGAGVVRLSLGDNSELGGAVGGGWVRWNFFTDATVQVDGATWIEGGRLTAR
jgi:hypothetical protein